jgi:hypothetical protein
LIDFSLTEQAALDLRNSMSMAAVVGAILDDSDGCSPVHPKLYCNTGYHS